jgi:hypothetical protein
MGVAISDDFYDRPTRIIRFAVGDDPYLTDAAAHLIGVIVLGLAQRRQRASELDDVTIAIFPIIQESEIVSDTLDGLQTRRPSQF